MFMRCTGSTQNDKSSKPINGRWSNNEHAMFLEALNLYGREWKKVAVHIQTRSCAQVRSHAQKYFKKLEKEEGLGMHGGAAAIHGAHIVLVDPINPGTDPKVKQRKRRQPRPADHSCTKKMKKHETLIK